MAWDYSDLDRLGSDAVSNVGLESVDVYRFLAREFAKGDVTANRVFQFAFRSFYGIDRAGLTSDFKQQYFRCMQSARDDGRADIEAIAATLRPYKTLRDCESLQFSFITKLANMIDPSLPIWDFKAARLIGQDANASGAYERRLQRMSARYEILKSVAAELAESDLGARLVSEFRTTYCTDEAEVPTAKVLDFIMWAASAECRIRQA